MAPALLLFVLLQAVDSTPPRPPVRTVAVDERLMHDAGLRLGQQVVLSGKPNGAGDTAVISAVLKRTADPSEIARGEYRVRLHLTQLADLIGYGDRVDRFAVQTRPGVDTGAVVAAINSSAFGFQAYRSRAIAVETSRTFLVVSRFHRAIGVITIVASGIFLLCIMLLKVDERRREVAALRMMGISARSIVLSVMLESAAVAGIGGVAGVLLGRFAAAIVNWHYQGVYRTPLAFAVVTRGIVLLAVALSVTLGLAAGFVAAQRLVRTPPLALLSGRREHRARSAAARA
jgi:predicted lysophospholipase L1 biosynthesis ABC-type transport system permease subunit